MMSAVTESIEPSERAGRWPNGSPSSAPPASIRSTRTPCARGSATSTVCGRTRSGRSPTRSPGPRAGCGPPSSSTSTASTPGSKAALRPGLRRRPRGHRGRWGTTSPSRGGARTCRSSGSASSPRSPRPPRPGSISASGCPTRPPSARLEPARAPGSATHRVRLTAVDGRRRRGAGAAAGGLRAERLTGSAGTLEAWRRPPWSDRRRRTLLGLALGDRRLRAGRDRAARRVRPDVGGPRRALRLPAGHRHGGLRRDPRAGHPAHAAAHRARWRARCWSSPSSCCCRPTPSSAGSGR